MSVLFLTIFTKVRIYLICRIRRTNNHHSPICKLHEENQKCDKVDAIPRMEFSSVATQSRCPRQDPIGDIQNISDCNNVKYSLDMSIMLQSYRIWMAKGAIGNKKISGTE